MLHLTSGAQDSMPAAWNLSWLEVIPVSILATDSQVYTPY